jgi:acyl carrier protein
VYEQLSRERIRETVAAALASAAARPTEPGQVGDDTSIGDAGLGLSSLNVLQALVKIEDSFGVLFDDRTVAQARLFSVGTVVDLVSELLDGTDR